MKKILFLNSTLLFSKSIFAAGKILKTAALLAGAVNSGIYADRTINVFNEFFEPVPLAGSRSCLLTTKPSIADDVVYNTAYEHELAVKAKEALYHFESTEHPNLRGSHGELMTHCPRSGYHQFYKKTGVGPELYVLGPQGWEPRAGLNRKLEELGYKRNLHPPAVSESYTNTFAKTICAGHPDESAWGCVFIIPFGHNGLNSTKAEVVAHDFVSKLRNETLLEQKDIELEECVADPNVPVKKLLCDEFDNCVAIAYRLIGPGSANAQKALHEGIDREFTRVYKHDFNVEKVEPCKIEEAMCCVIDQLQEL